MKKEALAVNEALAGGMPLPYALVRSLSQVSLGPTPGEPPMLDELLETRFFDEKQEVRLFRREGVLCAAAGSIKLMRSKTKIWANR